MFGKTMVVVSDAHVRGEVGDETESFLAFLEQVPALGDCLLINGDLFEFWFSYRRAIPQRGFLVAAALATQPRIISRLDVMIAALEKKTGGKGGGLGGDKPAEKSTLKKGKMQNGNLRAVKNEGDRWANLTPKEREKVLQSQGEGFPAGYEDVLADYFRKLSKSEKPAAAAPVKDAKTEQPKTPEGSK